MNLTDPCRRVELILSDVDGVLTDGGIWYDNQGVELKGFHIRDGLGIKLWQRAGFRFGVLTARTSHIVKLRAGELGIDIVRQGFEDKLPVAQEIIRELRPDARAGLLHRRRPDRPAGDSLRRAGRRGGRRGRRSSRLPRPITTGFPAAAVPSAS